ncbi:MAG: hypothetical protein ACFE8A_08550 [Candidatus Hodarchaeota archaeon]
MDGGHHSGRESLGALSVDALRQAGEKPIGRNDAGGSLIIIDNWVLKKVKS